MSNIFFFPIHFRYDFILNNKFFHNKVYLMGLGLNENGYYFVTVRACSVDL